MRKVRQNISRKYESVSTSRQFFRMRTGSMPLYWPQSWNESSTVMASGTITMAPNSSSAGRLSRYGVDFMTRRRPPLRPPLPSYGGGAPSDGAEGEGHTD